MASEILKECMGRGFLLDKSVLSKLSVLKNSSSKKVVEALGSLGINERVITLNTIRTHSKALLSFFSRDGEAVEVINLLNELAVGEVLGGFGDDLIEDGGGKVKLLSAPAFPQKKIEIKDFLNHFRSRYELLRSILETRDFGDLTSIRKIGENKGNNTIIAMVSSKKITKNKNILLEVEDMTGRAIILVNQNRKDIFEKGSNLLVDDVVAFSVSGDSKILFANDIIYPDSSLDEKRKSNFDEYVAFVSDFHAGSTMFLEKNLIRFVKWLNGEEGDLVQKRLAKKVKYLFIVGDNIDGVNHYPGQERHLEEKTSEGQYGKVGNILRLVRKDIKMIMCPGQHDSVWVGEPQPIIGEKWAPGIYGIENLCLVPNPALVEIDGGFKILMYHGASINRFIDEIPEIRTKYGHMCPTKVVKEFLKRRHLAPMHGMVDYVPCVEDPLVIKTVPDIIVTGDQHRVEVANYNNILVIASSCWQSITPFEEKVGNVPDPCKVPLFNLKTREIKILDFSDEPVEVDVEMNACEDVENEN